MKKFVSVCLLSALCLTLLTGCGAAKSAEPAVEAQTEEVYTARFQTLAFPEGVDPSLWALTENGVYAAAYEKLADGEVPEGKTLDYEGQYDVMGYRLYRVTADGSVKQLDYSSLPAPEDTEGRNNYSASTNLERLFPAPDGGLTAVECQSESWYTGTELRPENSEDYWDHVESRYAFFIRRLDAEGRELASHPLDYEGDWLNLNNAVTDSEGNLYATSDQTILVFNTDGEQLARIDAGNWVYDLVRLRDGRVAAEMWNGEMQFLAVNVERGELEKQAVLDAFYEELIGGSGGYDFYYSNGTHLYGLRAEDQTGEDLVDLLDCDLSIRNLNAVEIAADGGIRGVYRDEDHTELVTLQKTTRDAVADRQELTLGTLYSDNVSDAVLRFNRSQDKVRIRVKSYSDYVSGGDYEAGLTKLVTEILAGDMPDLLALDSLPYAQLAAKGLLEDLYPYLDADGELNRAGFFENVLQSMEVGGGLYEVTPGFTIITAMGPSEIVGDTPGWTYDEFDAALASMPEGCTAFGPAVDRDNILEMCTYLNLDSFVDWGSGRCDFENESFIRMLEFCARFPKPENMLWDDGGSDMIRIAEGRQLLVFTSLYSMDDAVYNDQYFAGKSTYIGLPTEEGTGNVIYPANGYAMSANCADKEAAWSFLRTFLTEEYQMKYSGYETGLPLNRNAFQTALDKAMEIEYQTDAEGHYILDADGERIPVSKGGMGVSLGEDAIMEFELWAMTPEQAEKLLNVVETSTRAVDMNTAVCAIVKEEAAAYFAGQKSAEEVARLVQSKVNLYVSEQR